MTDQPTTDQPTTAQSTARRRTTRLIAAWLALALLGVCSHSSKSSSGPSSSTTERASASTAPPTTRPRPATVKDQLRIEVLSSQPDRVTGGDARIRVTPPTGVPVSSVRVKVGATDVTSHLTTSSRSLEGVVSGFPEGLSSVVASAGSLHADQTIHDWPIVGPVLSGPHMPLLACSTEQAGLGAPTDANCSAPTKVTYRYISTDKQVKDLPDPSARPADLATATIAGKAVPLIVRVEKGTINRSVYEIDSVDPTPGGTGTAPSGTAWNGRLAYLFGGGCGTSFGQGTPLVTAEDPALLSQGYATATATFNTFQVQCNDVLSAETALMVKERFIEAFGVPVHTIGEGASGGSIQLHLIAQNYPGLVDGVAAILPFPDAITIAAGVTDCGLLNNYYRGPGTALTPAQRSAINGQLSPGTCDFWETSFLGGVRPSDGCDPAIPPAKIYDPKTNRGGIRCTLQDANVNQLGRDAKTGFANRPLDNVGVQYGLKALNAKQITFDQFAALNRTIGGYDIDGNPQPAREAADPAVVAHTYESGRVSSGGGDQTQIPMIDLNIYTDPAGDIHDRFRAFALRDRLVGANGSVESAPGFQIWTRGSATTTLTAAVANITSGGGYGPEMVGVIDRWLDAMDRDHSSATTTQKLQRDRPAEAVDNCIDPATGKRLSGVGIYDKPGPCRDAFPIHGDARTAAGESRADDIIKCQLKPVDPSDYDVAPTKAQLAVLAKIFPSGVCDWRQGGVGQGPPKTPAGNKDGNNPDSGSPT